MAVREQFDQELTDVKDNVIQLARLSGKALEQAIDALYSQNTEKAEAIIQYDAKIDRMEMEINEKAVLLIAKQQPVAKDLRRIIMTLRIVTDIERMADNAKNIANSTIQLAQYETSVPLSIRNMYEKVTSMLNRAILAFEHEDITLAKQLAVMDDEIDELYHTMISELLGETATNPEKIQYVMQVAFIARYLERFADHITNIGESILYLVKGENYKL
ncbi:phosphate transport system regulatory protein PhoU [Compostibacillus humi]|uniref:Phosphate-specific transport system accessory protein PhoU n=1 Tax=Compostibacillus humi TaxID=1245525 RepID=A0A8J2TTS1_9BACI|nr:phosphate signaling complex protein PhoU [Compostibacillus humi]GFZ90605.1 phosphate transport system regulatory protein PhoU [Compostibacillus humi]